MKFNHKLKIPKLARDAFEIGIQSSFIPEPIHLSNRLFTSTPALWPMT